MSIIEITTNKKQYLKLLLLADEQESMIDRYLIRGRMFALLDGGIKALCVVTDEGDGILEIKNIVVDPPHQKSGYGKCLICFLEEYFRDQYQILQVGTGDSPLTVPFYMKCGFQLSHRIKNSFIENYDHPIIECGVQVDDMLYFCK